MPKRESQSSEWAEGVSVAIPRQRAYVPPLEVVLEDVGDSDEDDGATLRQEAIIEKSVVAKRKDRHLKRKEKEDRFICHYILYDLLEAPWSLNLSLYFLNALNRELEISASEERRLQKDILKTEDEFEKLVRSSPNSSFVWIKYMAFMLSLADIEKAHAIAERSLPNFITIFNLDSFDKL